MILQRLLDRGEDVRLKIWNRLKVDAKPAQYSDAAARVESRRANVIRAQNALALASDHLKVLMNDPELTVGSDVLLLPADFPLDQPIIFSLLDSFRTGIANRPEVQRAILSMDNTSIRLTVADNAREPNLNMRLQTQFSGEGGSLHGGYHDLTTGNHVDYGIGFQFEQPIGNREAEAGFKQRRLERSQAVIAYRNTVQNVVLEVTAGLRNVVMNFKLIEQTRAARIAAAENLRTLQVEEDLIQGLTAEFLNLKLQRQELLAASEQDEAQALTDYNSSLARLYTAMGTAMEHNHINFVVPDVEPIDVYGPVFPTWNQVFGGEPEAGSTEEPPASAQPEPGGEHKE
jgi:outer membrane protein TolC